MRTLAALLAIFLCCSVVFGAEVEFSVSQRETEVGLPITFSIEIINAEKFQRPDFPRIADATVQETAGVQESSMTTIVNGRMTTRTSRTLTYRITPHVAGTLTIPPLTVIADGQSFTSQTVHVIVGQSEFTKTDLLVVEIDSPRQSIYLGQSLSATLRIWIRPYQNKEFNVRLSADQMWSRIDVNASTWGDFADALMNSRDAFGRWQIAMQEVLREDGQGNPRSYYLFEVPATIWPMQSGTLTLQPPRIVVNYPARIGRQRDFFGGGNLAITEFRSISAVATLPPVEVRSPPEERQPSTFNGAIGRFDIAVTAKPLDVAVGDPITLTINVVDRSNGQARLDLLPPPPLDRVPELVEHFKIPSEPLAGVVGGGMKAFTQTIRAKTPDVIRIPAIPLTYFDPDSEQYVTRYSDPIAISVKAGLPVGIGEIVSSSGLPVSSGSTELRSVSGGILANYADVPLLLASDAYLNRNWSIMAMTTPPLLFVIAWIGRLILTSRYQNEAAMRRRMAKKRAVASLKSVLNSDAVHQARVAIAALHQYVNDRLTLNGRTVTTGEMAALLRENNVSDGQIAEVEGLLMECDHIAYGRGTHHTGSDLAQRALACIGRLEGH